MCSFDQNIGLLPLVLITLQQQALNVMLALLLTLPQSNLILSFFQCEYLHFLLDTVDLSTSSIIYLNLKSYIKHNLSFLRSTPIHVA